MKRVSKDVKGCEDCPCESIHKGLDQRVMCNADKSKPRMVLVMYDLSKAREILQRYCPFPTLCPACFGEGKKQESTSRNNECCEGKHEDTTCGMCEGSGLL